MKLINYLTILLLATALNSCKKDNAEAPAPFIGFTIYNPVKSQPDTVGFTATSTIPCTYKWNFGDGSAEGTGEAVSHIFDIGYYYVTLNAVSEANKTASIFKGVNTSRFKRAAINTIQFSQLPATRSDGTAWETDGSRPDVFCEVSTGVRTAITATLNNADVGTGININLNFFPSFSDSLFELPLVIKIYNSNVSPYENDLMETITFDKNLTELMTNQEPYVTTKPFLTTTVAGQIGFNWIQ